MVDQNGVAAAGSSLVRFLSAGLTGAGSPVSSGSVKVLTARTEDLKQDDDPVITAPCLSLFLYRVDYNKTMRAAWAAVGSVKSRSFLPLDLHYLLIPWGRNADEEYRIIGRAIQILDETPILSGPLLDPITQWNAGESLQVCMGELSTEELMHTFDSLPIEYKLSIPYVVRILTLEGRTKDVPEAVRADIRISARVNP